MVKNLISFIKNILNKNVVNTPITDFYCELDGNWAHQRCKKQCQHCKEVEVELNN